MSPQKGAEVLRIYKEKLPEFFREMMGSKDADLDIISPKPFPESKLALPDFSDESVELNELLVVETNIFRHLGFMLDKMEGFLNSGDMTKFYGWLCFIQGVCWRSGFQTIKELNDFNRETNDQAPFPS